MNNDLLPIRSVHDRYESDPSFRQLVHMMWACIENAQFTPTEMREAAMLAQILYEERNTRRVLFTREDVLGGKV